MHPFLNKKDLNSWSNLKAEHIVPDLNVALDRAQKAIEKLIAQKSTDYSYKNCFVCFEKITEIVFAPWKKVLHLSAVCDNPDIRAAKSTMLPQITQFFSGIYLNEDIWRCLEEAYNSGESLTPLEIRHRDIIRDAFIKNGAQLPADKKAQLAEINQALAKKTQKYSENVLDSINAWEEIIACEEELIGLPESAKKAARMSAQSKGYDEGWRFTLQRPSLFAVLQHSQNAALREKMWYANSLLGRSEAHNNLPLVVDILDLRTKKAKLLGYDNFPDLVLEKRMAQTGKNAMSFIEDLHAKVQGIFQDDIKKLQEWIAQKNQEPVQALQPWDFSFYSECLRKELYDFDEELLRPYFPVDSVLEGLFQIAHTLYGITIRECATCFGREAVGDEVEVWHESVRAYQVFEDGDRCTGYFYTDWFPRDTKRPGAWMNPLSTAEVLEDGSKTLNIGVITGNLSAPIGDEPALLKHKDVVTIFHEFGHLLHHLLGKVSISGLNGTSVAWDFVELPSQIMENWCWQEDALKIFAKHYKTQEPIPSALFQKLDRARNFNSAYAMMRQLSFAKLDMELHLSNKARNVETLDAEIAEFLSDYSIDFAVPTKSNIAAFGHLFSSSVGYAAGYYSYKWAEVLDADAFSRFKKEGIFNAQVGREFHDSILSQGNAQPPEKLFVDFMGRDPDPEALLRRSGLLM